MEPQRKGFIVNFLQNTKKFIILFTTEVFVFLLRAEGRKLAAGRSDLINSAPAAGSAVIESPAQFQIYSGA
jgi:hypothetical protein